MRTTISRRPFLDALASLDFKFKIYRFQIFKKDKRICGLTFELFVCYPMLVEYWPVVTKVSERSGIGRKKLQTHEKVVENKQKN